MNIERLIELKNLLLSIPENKFNLGFWIKGFNEEGIETEKLLGECGTTACAVGWACSHKPFNELGLSYRVELDWDDELIGYPYYNGDTSWDAVCYFFEITPYTAHYLFDIEDYHCSGIYNPNTKDVIDRIDKVIEQGEN